MSYNKIVTPLIKIQNIPPSGGKAEITSNLQMISSLLIQESATEIFIIPYDEQEKEQVSKELDGFPAFFRNRVKIGDENFSIKTEIQKYLEPTYQIGTVGNSRNNSDKGEATYSDPYLETAIRILAIACKKNAEADIPLMKGLKNRLSWAKQNCNDGEGKARLDNLIGLFNCYDISSNAGFHVNYNNPNAKMISSRLDELLAESDIQELSEIKYSFGIPAKLKALSDLKTLLHLKSKKLYENRKFRDLLSNVPQVTALAASQGTFSLPYIPLPDWERYNPPIVDLTEIRTKLLATIPNLGSHSFLLGNSPLSVSDYGPGEGGLVAHIPGTIKTNGKRGIMFQDGLIIGGSPEGMNEDGNSKSGKPTIEISNVKFFNRVLTPEEVKRMYDEGPPTTNDNKKSKNKSKESDS
jgi:hypothetical protein